MDNPESDGLTDWLKLDLRPGDMLDPNRFPFNVIQSFNGMTTASRRKSYGCWRYWNFGRPDETREEHLDQARRELRVMDDRGAMHAIPDEVLETGLVYLTATVSGSPSSAVAEEYDAYQAAFDLPPWKVEYQRQQEELKVTMDRVRTLVWD